VEDQAVARHTFWRGVLAAGLGLAALAAAATVARAAYIEEEFPGPARDRVTPPGPPVRPPEPYRPPRPQPPAGPHVPELAACLDRLDILTPLVSGRLAVFPVVARAGPSPGGRWWTADAAIAKGILVVTEREGGGEVPVIVMENRSRSDHVFVMGGEVVSGGKQTRTVRQDVVLAPGQRVQVPVFCVEAHRWHGDAAFRGGEALVPQSIQRELRKGADQAAIWGEVARSNADLGAASATGNLEDGLRAAPVRRDLERVRRSIVPEVPAESVGFIFVDRRTGRGIGAELFGRADLARALLTKLIDAYAVDLVLPAGGGEALAPPPGDAAWDFLNRIRRAGSYRTETPGSGAGIGQRAAGLVGNGVGLGGDLVHFGSQAEAPVIVAPRRPGPPRRRGTPEPLELYGD